MDAMDAGVGCLWLAEQFLQNETKSNEKAFYFLLYITLYFETKSSSRTDDKTLYQFDLLLYAVVSARQ